MLHDYLIQEGRLLTHPVVCPMNQVQTSHAPQAGGTISWISKLAAFLKKTSSETRGGSGTRPPPLPDGARLGGAKKMSVRRKRRTDWKLQDARAPVIRRRRLWALFWLWPL